MAAATRPPLAILFLVATLHAAYALADPPPFVAIDAFSSCDPSVFPNEKDVEQWGILPRSKFEILGVVCTVEGCHYEEFIPEFPSLNGAGPPWCVDASTNCINGGVPQRANLTRQLEIFDQRIGAWIPDEEWDGWAALEFENWTPIWEENTDPTSWHGLRYQQYSIALVKAEFPSLNETEVVAKAKEEYEEGAVAFMKGVLDHLHQLRPKARFGFYGFPNQYYCTLGCTDGCNCYADPTDGAILGARNDKASAVWDASGEHAHNLVPRPTATDILSARILSHSRRPRTQAPSSRASTSPAGTRTRSRRPSSPRMWRRRCASLEARSARCLPPTSSHSNGHGTITPSGTAQASRHSSTAWCPSLTKTSPWSSTRPRTPARPA